MVGGNTGEQRPAGVYGVDPDGREHQVHLYQAGPYTLSAGPYTLSDVVDLFDLGRLEERGSETVLVLRAEEVGTLKPGFPRWLPAVADDGGTKGVPARIRPQIGTADGAPPTIGLIWR